MHNRNDLAETIRKDNALDRDTRSKLHEARKLRNAIAHEAYNPSKREAERIVTAIKPVLEKAKSIFLRLLGNKILSAIVHHVFI